jgi:hypothetical protein
MEAIFLPLSILQAAKAADLGGTQRHRGASHKLAALIVKLNRADNSALYAPPSTLGLQRIGRDSPKSAALIH